MLSVPLPGAQEAWNNLASELTNLTRPTPCQMPNLRPAFHSASRSDQRASAEFCKRACPVMAACQRYALEAKEAYGVWGGRTEWDRETNPRSSRAKPTTVRIINIGA